jgi:hypothetical protein
MQPEPGPSRQPPRWLIVTAAALVVGLAAGWFLLSWAVMHTAAGDAAEESLGVAFGLLVTVSAVGAVIGRHDRDAY